MNDFLPICQEDMQKRGWHQCDFILVSADAYVDHPSFGHAIIARVLEQAGYKVGILPQPDWKDPQAIKALGRPKYAFLVSGGNIDSMVNHYSVSKKRRSTDAYSPGGIMGLRPDRATLVYCNLIRAAYKKMPIVIGGIEASLRRFAHYDYWSDSVRRSLLVDCDAHLLLYGMGEKSIVEVADALASGVEISYLQHIAGSCYVTNEMPDDPDAIVLPDYDTVVADKSAYVKASQYQYLEQDPIRGKRLIQAHGRKILVQNPPAMPLTQQEMDAVYELPFMRLPHPSYAKKGGIPAIQEVQFSLVSERGCFGSCTFCALTFHQGRIIQTRSHESIVEEAELMVKEPQFKGNIHDVGGPTANFRHMSCKKQLKVGTCRGKDCLFPKPCKHLTIDHQDYKLLLQKLRNVKGVKRVFVRSGLRYDYLMADKDETFMRELCAHHVSGQLKIAPEHIAPEVLHFMGKPGGQLYTDFVARFYKTTEEVGKEQYIVPYLMSSHPGSTLKSSIQLAEYLRDTKYQPEQVQDFYPTPGTLSTTMYYTGIDPRDGKPVYVPKTFEEKMMQRALLQYSRPDNYTWVEKALQLAGRMDLIGNGPKCLIRARNQDHDYAKKRALANKAGKTAGKTAGKFQEKSTGKVGAKPMGKPKGKSAGKVAGNLSDKPTGKQTGKPTGKQTGKQMGRTSEKPTGKATTKPAGKPMAKATAKPAGKPVGKSASKAKMK